MDEDARRYVDERVADLRRYGEARLRDFQASVDQRFSDARKNADERASGIAKALDKAQGDDTSRNTLFVAVLAAVVGFAGIVTAVALHFVK